MNEPSLEAQLAALQARLEVLEAARSPRRSWTWAKLLIAGSVLVAATASAQLVSFSPDQPALASQVNGNFNQLKTWLEAKVGPVTSAGVTAASVTATGNVGTNTLTVTSGLPITIENDFVRNLANDAVEQLIFIADDNGRRVCFLAGMEIHDSFTDESQALCHVERNGAAGWQLRIDVDTGAFISGAAPGDTDVVCRARCITW